MIVVSHPLSVYGRACSLLPENEQRLEKMLSYRVPCLLSQAEQPVFRLFYHQSDCRFDFVGIQTGSVFCPYYSCSVTNSG